MKRQYNTIEIDVDKLNDVVRKVGNVDIFASSLGHTHGWVSKIRDIKRIRQVDYIFIKEKYGVDLKKEEPTVEEVRSDNTESNPILQQIMEDNKKIIEQLTSLEEQTADIAVSLRTIGNLLTQINEKCYKKPYVK